MDATTISQETAPVELSPMSEDQGERAIESLLSGNLAQPDPVPAKEAPAGTEAVEDDELAGLSIESDDEGGEPEGEPAPAQTIGDDFMVTLSDGQQISLGDLKRNNLFQRDYSRKTEELKTERARVEQENRQWREAEEKTLVERRNAILTLAQHFLPQEPNPEMLDQNSPNYDPIGYMTADQDYKRRVTALQGVLAQQEQETKAQQEKQQAEARQAFANEHAEFRNRLPKFKDQAKADVFFSEASGILESVYKIDPNVIGRIRTAAELHILHDAVQFQKLKAKGAQAVKQLPSAPKLEGRQRSTPMTEQARDERGRFEALRKTGSVEDADRAIEALLLRKG